MTTLEKYIQSFFGIVRLEEIQPVVSLFKPDTLEKGDFFLKTGSYCDQLSFVKTGLLRVFANQDGNEITQWISEKGYFVTDLASFVFESPARWTIQALSPVELFTINRVDYRKIGDLVPEWHKLEKLFIARCFTALEDRVFTHLSMTAEERYQTFWENNRELFNQIPLKYIASMLGMTPETFSRIRKKQLV